MSFKTIASKIIEKIVPLKKAILFESCPDFTDNTKPVFDEMIRIGVNKKYKLIWMCYDKDLPMYPKTKNVSFLNVNKHKYRSYFLYLSAKIIVCCNRFVGSNHKNQLVFYLCHGTPFKEASSYYSTPAFVDYVVGTSNYLKPILARQLKFDESRILVLGFPRTDLFFSKKKSLKDCFGQFEKFVVWYPTVKTFKGGRKTGSVQPIQFIWNKEAAGKINDFASRLNILIIIKPHFAQLTSDIKKMPFSNIVFVSEDSLKEKGLSSYDLIHASDALLTDYSSIYSDYLLLDKPIGLIWEDIEQYSKNPGLVKEYEFMCKGGTKIYTANDLCAFLNDVKNDNDLLKKERKTLIHYLHNMSDGNSASRVAKKIIELSGLKV